VVFWTKVKDEERLLLYRFFTERATDQQRAMFPAIMLPTIKTVATVCGYVAVDVAEVETEIAKFPYRLRSETTVEVTDLATGKRVTVRLAPIREQGAQ
jgi:hypothetical protein